MAPEWFKTAIQGPAYGQHMRRPGLNPFYSETLFYLKLLCYSGCNGGVCYCNDKDYCNDRNGSSREISMTHLIVFVLLYQLLN